MPTAAGTGTDRPTGRRVGRPRDEAVDAAILEATVDELVERGFLAFRIESVAARAKVAKTTVYRRWSDQHELALAAMRSIEVAAEPPSAYVDARQGLLQVLDALRRRWANPRYAALMRRVTADASVDPEQYAQARDRLVEPHLRVMRAALRRAVDDGLIAPDVDLALVHRLLTSPIIAAAFTLKHRTTRADLESTLDLVLRGVAPR